MNREQVKSNRHQANRGAMSRGGKLTDNVMTWIDGERERLAGKRQEAYGISKPAAKRRIDTHQ